MRWSWQEAWRLGGPRQGVAKSRLYHANVHRGRNPESAGCALARGSKMWRRVAGGAIGIEEPGSGGCLASFFRGGCFCQMQNMEQLLPADRKNKSRLADRKRAELTRKGREARLELRFFEPSQSVLAKGLRGAACRGWRAAWAISLDSTRASQSPAKSTPLTTRLSAPRFF